MTAEHGAGRDRILTTLAVLMGLLAISNLMKPVSQAFAPESSAGFVLFGRRLQGVANAVASPAFGVFLATYAWAIWSRRRLAVPMGLLYAAYVPVNLVLFALDPPPGSGGPVFGAIYSLV
ncbi:MAG: hypothetical protein ACREQ9_04275, partial [Candidatus Binatia bacterium]